MFRMRRVELLLIGGLLAALPSVVAAQAGRGVTMPVRTDTAATVPADRLIQRYTALAGTEENARNLVTGLRDGTDVTLTDSSTGGTVTVVNPADKMGWGNVNITLALAEKQLSAISNPGPADLNNALTNADNGILALRASGMGWGEIAQALGFKLGEVMRADSAKGAPSAARKEGRAAPQHVASGSSDRPEMLRNGFERPQKAERPEKPEKPEKPQRPERGGR